MQLQFIDCVVSGNNPVRDFFEKYFFVEGLSPLLGIKKYRLISGSQHSIRLNVEGSGHFLASAVLRVMQIFSYFTILMPAIMLVGKVIFRSQRTYRVVSENTPPNQQQIKIDNLFRERITHFLPQDQPFIKRHIVSQELETALDAIFKAPMPKLGTFDFCDILEDRGVICLKSAGLLDGHQMNDNVIAKTDHLKVVLKAQGIFSRLKSNPKQNLQRLEMNEKIERCIAEKNLNHVTFIKKQLYLLPDLTNSSPVALSDENSIVVAELIDPIDLVVDFETLTLEQYDQLLTLITDIKYADSFTRNIVWINKKLALLDTEDVASKYIHSDKDLQYYCTQTFDVPWTGNNQSLAFARQAKAHLATDKERARKIIKLLWVYHKGIEPLKPKSEGAKKELFEKVCAQIYQEIRQIA